MECSSLWLFKAMVSKFPFNGRIETGAVISSVWAVMGGFRGGREVGPGALRSFPCLICSGEVFHQHGVLCAHKVLDLLSHADNSGCQLLHLYQSDLIPCDTYTDTGKSHMMFFT